MTRIRCQGCMAKDHFIDLLESAEYPGMEGWHYCLDCGNILVPVMERNRLVQQEKVLIPSSGEPDHQDDEVNLGTTSIIRRAA